MPLQSVIGHRSVLKLIARAIGRDTLPPSLLFAGPDGVGKRLSATGVAQALNCREPMRSDDFDVDACGSCPSCLRIARYVHTDVIAIEPGETGSIKVEQVRDAIGHTAFRPFEGRKRAVIIDEADAMAPAAQSALLKNLEEPAPGSVFILTSAVPDALLPTVRSRCSIFRFRPLTVAEVARVLIRDHGYSATDAQSAAVDAGGSPARALERSVVDLVEARAVARRLLERAAHTMDPVRRIEIAEMIKVKGENAADERNRLAICLRTLLSLLRDVGVIASGADARLLANADLETELRHLAAAFDAGRSRRAFTAVADAIASLDRNASPKLVADWLVLQL
jgi:DNA polymerase III subunit delta'